MTKSFSEEHIEFILIAHISAFVNFERPPGVYEVKDLNSTLNDLVFANIAFDDVPNQKIFQFTFGFSTKLGFFSKSSRFSCKNYNYL